MNVTESLARLDRDFSGDLSVYARRMDDGETIRYRAAEVTPAASTLKTIVLAEVYRQAHEGAFALTDPNRLVRESVEQTYGSGVLRDLTIGLTLSIRDMCVLMMAVSDNVATNQLIQLVGFDSINEMAHRLGMKNTRIMREMFHLGEDSQIPFGETTAEDFGTLFASLCKGQVVSPQASKAMLDMMMLNHYKLDIIRYFPPELLLSERPASDPLVRVASKSGTSRGVKCNAGVVFAPDCYYVIALFSRNGTDLTPTVDNESQIVLPKASRVVYDAYCG